MVPKDSAARIKVPNFMCDVCRYAETGGGKCGIACSIGCEQVIVRRDIQDIRNRTGGREGYWVGHGGHPECRLNFAQL